MGGGERSADLDKVAGVTARRLGGDLLTPYNWVNNASNAGKNWLHASDTGLLEVLGVLKSDWARPAAVIEAMHDSSLEMGAVSLVTLPLAGYVCADFDGVVTPEQAAPSARFVPVKWTTGTRAGDPINPRVADIPQLIAKLCERYGDAKSGRGVMGYSLDNEPGLWFETHPRIVTSKPSIESFIARSITAASAIKSVDPTAKVFGPAAWGATEMVNFQGAPDWPAFQHYGSFLDAYLTKFNEASQRAGIRLLDVLDVHWYAFSRLGDLLGSEDEALGAVLLNAPRTLTDRGFREDSWVSTALPSGDGTGIRLPILPCLNGLIARAFPGTDLSVSEFNYGGGGLLAAGLAVADALGRMGTAGVLFAAHWGRLSGWLGEAYRLFRAPDVNGHSFGDTVLSCGEIRTPDLVAYAARSEGGAASLSVVLINKSNQSLTVDLVLRSGRNAVVTDVLGFDGGNQRTARLGETASSVEGMVRVQIPAFAARRYVLG